MICECRNRKSIAGKGKDPNLTTPSPDVAGESVTPLLQPNNRRDIHEKGCVQLRQTVAH